SAPGGIERTKSLGYASGSRLRPGNGAPNQALQSPYCLLTLIDKDRQWFKSQAGLPADLAEARSTPRDVSLCGHVIANDEVLIVRDLARDPRFANNPWLKERGLRFYAGVP